MNPASKSGSFKIKRIGLTEIKSELRSCVKFEVTVLGSPFLIVPTVSVDVKLH